MKTISYLACTELKDPITGMTEADRLLKKRKVLECVEASNTNIAQKFSGPPLRIHEGNDKSSCQKVAEKSAVHNGVSTNNQVLVVTGRPDDVSPQVPAITFFKPSARG